MTFVKGKSGNPKGKPTGAKNKRTEQWELFSDWMMSEGLIRFREEMGKLRGKDYVITVKDLLEYFQPKLARTEIEAKGDLNLNVTWTSPSPTAPEKNN